MKTIKDYKSIYKFELFLIDTFLTELTENVAGKLLTFFNYNLIFSSDIHEPLCYGPQRAIGSDTRQVLAQGGYYCCWLDRRQGPEGRTFRSTSCPKETKEKTVEKVLNIVASLCFYYNQTSFAYKCQISWLSP